MLLISTCHTFAPQSAVQAAPFFFKTIFITIISRTDEWGIRYVSFIYLFFSNFFCFSFPPSDQGCQMRNRQIHKIANLEVYCSSLITITKLIFYYFKTDTKVFFFFFGEILSRHRIGLKCNCQAELIALCPRVLN